MPERHSTDYCASEVNHEMLAAKTRGTYSWRVGFVFVETSTILTSLLHVPAATQQEDSVHRPLDMSCNVNLSGSLHVYEIAHAEVLTHGCVSKAPLSTEKCTSTALQRILNIITSIPQQAEFFPMNGIFLRSSHNSVHMQTPTDVKQDLISFHQICLLELLKNCFYSI